MSIWAENPESDTTWHYVSVLLILSGVGVVLESTKTMVTRSHGELLPLSASCLAVSLNCIVGAAVWTSSQLHDKMLDRVVHAPVVFFDRNPVGRILNRFTRDVSLMDEEMAWVRRMAS